LDSGTFCQDQGEHNRWRAPSQLLRLILASSSTPLFENGVASRGGKAVRADAAKLCLDKPETKHASTTRWFSLIRTLTVGSGISPNPPVNGLDRVADFNCRFEITSTPKNNTFILALQAVFRLPLVLNGFKWF
jgi:hypothetical protein